MKQLLFSLIMACVAALSLHAQCEIELELVEVTCDDNGTPWDPTDDVMYAWVNIIGTGSVSFNGWVSSSPGAEWADPTGNPYYDLYEFGPYSLLEPLPTIIIEDEEVEGCSASITIPLVACDTECLITPIQQALFTENNNTPDDCSDDVFYVQLQALGEGSLGSGWNVVDENGVRLPITYDYGSTIDLGPYPLQGGSATITVTDRFALECRESIEVTPPDLSCAETCETTLQTDYTLTYTDNDTQICSDDSVQIQIMVSDPAGSNDTYLIRDLWGNTYIGQLGEALVVGSYPYDTESLIFYLEAPCFEVLLIEDLFATRPCSDHFALELVSQSACAGEEVCIPLVTEGFTDMVAMQFSIQYDPAEVTFTEVQNQLLITALPNTSVLSIVNPFPGALTCTWNDPTAAGITLAPGTVLAELCFRQEQASSSPLVFSNSPTTMEFTDIYEISWVPDLYDGFVQSCNNACEIEANLTILPWQDNGTIDCSDDFYEIELNGSGTDLSASFDLLLNGNNLGNYAYEELVSVEIPVSEGVARLTLQDSEEAACFQHFTLPVVRTDCETCEFQVDELTFDIIDNSTPLCADDSVQLNFVLRDIEGLSGTYRMRDPFGSLIEGILGENVTAGPYPYRVNHVNLEMEEPCAQTIPLTGLWQNHDCEIGLAFSLPDTVSTCQEEICIPLQTDNFTDLLGLQFSINYDASLLRFSETRNYSEITTFPNSSALQVANPQPGNLVFIWNDPSASGATLAAGTTLVELCFEPLRPGSSTLTFSGDPTFVEVVNVEEQDVLPVFFNGNVEVECGEEECWIFADLTFGDYNHNGTSTCFDDWVDLMIIAYGDGEIGTTYEVLIDGVLVAIDVSYEETINIPFPADGAQHLVTIRDLENFGCAISYTLQSPIECDPCDIVVFTDLNYSDNILLFDPSDDLVNFTLLVTNSGDNSGTWILTDDQGNFIQEYPYEVEVTLAPIPACQDTSFFIVDAGFSDCMVPFRYTPFINQLIEMDGSLTDDNGTPNSCADDSVYFNISVPILMNDTWTAYDNFGHAYSGGIGDFMAGPYPVNTEQSQVEIWVFDGGCPTYLTAHLTPCLPDLSLDITASPSHEQFALYLANTAEIPATGISVSAPLPDRLYYQSSNANYNPATGLWQVDTLAPLSDTTLILEVVLQASGDSLFLAEVISMDQLDADSSPNNGVDTDGDGMVVDDLDDEDDGDGWVLCLTQADTLILSTDTLCVGQQLSWNFGSEQVVPAGYVAAVGVYSSPLAAADEVLGWFTSSPSSLAQAAGTYWLRSVVGPDTGNGTPGLADNCISFGPPQAVHWQAPLVTDCGDITLNCLTPSASPACTIEGEAPLTLRWLRNGVLFSSESQPIISEEGNYSLVVNDARGCSTMSDGFVVTENFDTPEVNIVITRGSICSESNPLRLRASLAEPNSSYSYLWSTGQRTAEIIVRTPGTYRVTVTNLSSGCTDSDELVITQSIGECNILSGYIWRSTDCVSTDSPLAGWLVQISNENYLEFRQSDANGFYHLPVPSGDYEVMLIPPSPVWQSCVAVHQLSFPTTADAQNLDLYATEADYCPLLSVDITLPPLRPCRSDRNIYVRYENVGTDTLHDGLIALILPPELTYLNTNGNFLEQRNDTLFFAAPTPLAPGASGNFWVRPQVSCAAQAGRTLCVRALGLPYGPCPAPAPSWSGASLLVNGYCEGEEVRFEIRNVGDEAMQERGENIVIQDIVMLMEAPDTFDPLPPGGSVDFRYPANGATYRMEVRQVTNHPGFSNPSVSVEGCGTDESGQVSTGMVPQYPFDDNDYYVDEDCRPVTNAYDPNDKQAEPLGYAEPHYIEPEQKIEYTIRFQNTGTDTAFQVIVRDTLSDWLDLCTFRPGTSSHPYELVLDSARQIAFVFDDILLPDSTTNEPASHGFVAFQIEPMPDIPLETVVTNQAAIYFDFNPPIFTNTTFHTVGRNYIQIVDWEDIQPYTINWRYYPNPGAATLSVEVRGEVDWPLQIHLQSLGGQHTYSYTLRGPETQLELGALPVGFYAVTLRDAGGRLLGQGKWVKGE